MISKGKLATNKTLVEKAVEIIENLGVKILTPNEVRNKLNLTKKQID